MDGVFTPLADAGTSLLETVDAYGALGHSLEGTARELFVHANTVRYRLKRVAEVTGWDPLVPRDAYVLQTAITLGRLAGRGRRPGQARTEPGRRPPLVETLQTDSPCFVARSARDGGRS